MQTRTHIQYAYACVCHGLRSQANVPAVGATYETIPGLIAYPQQQQISILVPTVDSFVFFYNKNAMYQFANKSNHVH